MKTHNVQQMLATLPPWLGSISIIFQNVSFVELFDLKESFLMINAYDKMYKTS